jgi:hypothetical protein
VVSVGWKQQAEESESRMELFRGRLGMTCNGRLEKQSTTLRALIGDQRGSRILSGSGRGACSACRRDRRAMDGARAASLAVRNGTDRALCHHTSCSSGTPAGRGGGCAFASAVHNPRHTMSADVCISHASPCAVCRGETCCGWAANSALRILTARTARIYPGRSSVGSCKDAGPRPP